MEEVFKVKGVEVGGIYPTNSCGDLVVESFTRERDNSGRSRVYVNIKFITTGSTKKLLVENIRSGVVKDCYKPIVHGVGYLGEVTSKGVEGIYDTWYNMLSRCYSDCGKNQKYYAEVFVAKEWHDFSVFLKYYKRYYIEGYQLDKDLLSKEGHKIYSPSTCCFLPKEINKLLGNLSKGEGVRPQGQKWSYGGSTYPSRLFATKVEAYQYRSECFQDRLTPFLYEYGDTLEDTVVEKFIEIMYKEINKTG
jgi:hypothetical protein